MPARLALILVVFTLTSSGVLVTYAQQTPIEVPPGETGRLTCGTGFTGPPAVTTTEITSEPCALPTPTPVPRPAGSGPRDGLPLCAHDQDQWHGAYDPVNDCHYDHLHAFNPDDPKLLELFGDVRQHTGGRTVSYPWLRQVGDVSEQTHKHEGYRWDGRWDRPCLSDFARNCIRAYRIQAHITGSHVDAVSRVHSYWMEAQVCQDRGGGVAGTCGIIRGGGHTDTGILVQPYGPGSEGVHIPLPGQDPPLSDPAAKELFDQDNDGIYEQRIPYRFHGGYRQTPEGALSRSPGNTILWNMLTRIDKSNPFTSISVRIEDAHDFVNHLDPHTFNPMCRNGPCKENSSTFGAASMMAEVDPLMDGGEFDADGAVNGFVTWSGWTNLLGYIDTDCNMTGPSCVPLIMENVPVGSALWESNVDTELRTFSPFDVRRVREYDQSPAHLGTGTEWWLTPSGRIP